MVAADLGQSVSGWDRRGPRVQFSKTQVSIILRRDHRRCYLCSAEATEADHVIPIAEGGRNDLSNGRAICGSCHETKSREESARGYARRMSKLRLPPDPHPFYARKTDG
jgi:5-methylcytosine-specific restriction protein A